MMLYPAGDGSRKSFFWPAFVSPGMSLRPGFDSKRGMSLRDGRLCGPCAAGGSSFRGMVRASAGREPSRLGSWVCEKRESSSARWECGNRACGDFQGAVGNVGNRSLVFHVFHGPAFPPRLAGRPRSLPGLHSPLLTSPPGSLLFPSSAVPMRPPHSAAAAVLVRPLRGPHLSRWPWWSRRSSMAPTAAASPSSLPQSSTGRLEVSSVLARS